MTEPPCLEALALAVARLDSRISEVARDLGGLKSQARAHLDQRPLQHQKVNGVWFEDMRSTISEKQDKELNKMSDCVNDVAERLQRLELLLFRLPVPDFRKLDEAIDKLQGVDDPWTSAVSGDFSAEHSASSTAGAAPAAAVYLGEDSEDELEELKDDAKCEALDVSSFRDAPDVSGVRTLIEDSATLEDLGIFEDICAFDVPGVTTGSPPPPPPAQSAAPPPPTQSAAGQRRGVVTCLSDCVVPRKCVVYDMSLGDEKDNLPEDSDPKGGIGLRGHRVVSREATAGEAADAASQQQDNKPEDSDAQALRVGKRSHLRRNRTNANA